MNDGEHVKNYLKQARAELNELKVALYEGKDLKDWEKRRLRNLNFFVACAAVFVN
jgi:hypothetical protein